MYITILFYIISWNMIKCYWKIIAEDTVCLTITSFNHSLET